MKISQAQFDIQGHRGCRGLLPENTIPAFIKAVQLGVPTLELDVVITADHQVLVSHDPFMSHEICLSPEGKSISKSDEKNHNIYKMDLLTAQRYDCGSIVNKRFPDQEKMNMYKPLLTDVIYAVEKYVLENNLKPVNYNIETKCTPNGDFKFHPGPDVFADLLLDVITKKNILERSMIQSFDVRTLQYLHKRGAGVKLVLLVENIRGPAYNIKKLGFKPHIYSPYYKLINSKKIAMLHSQGIQVIPWTVNDVKEMKKMIDMGVDGLITDYPDRLIKLLNP